MNPLQGLNVEKEIACAIDSKRVEDLPTNLKYVIKQLFPLINNDSLISATTYDDVFKADIKITIDDKCLNLSVKSGRATILHNEILDNFLLYLEKLGVSKRSIETIRLFHYGDETTDGTGKRRMDYNEVMTKYAERIAEANYEMNGNRLLVQSVVNRCMFDGSHEEYVKADAIYFGDVEYGVLATKQQILKHIQRKYYSYYKTLHIGPLILRPDCRYVDRPVNDQRKRNRIVVYWPALDKDIDYISNRYN